LFERVTGFAQISPNLTVVVDHQNHCLRSVNPQSGETATYAGRCTEPLQAIVPEDGELIGGVQFYYPHSIAYHQGALYLTEAGNHALRRLSDGRTTTLIHGRDKIGNVWGLAFSPFDDGIHVYFTSTQFGLLRFDVGTASLMRLTNEIGSLGSLSATRLNLPRGVCFVAADVIAIADYGRQQIILGNISEDSVSIVCNGVRETTDGDSQLCRLNYPRSVLLLNHSLFIGETESIRRIPLDSSVHPLVPTTTKRGEIRSGCQMITDCCHLRDCH